MQSMHEYVIRAGHTNVSTLMTLYGQGILFARYNEWAVLGPPRNNAQFFIHLEVLTRNSLKYSRLTL